MRVEIEMEQVLPSADPEDPFNVPIAQSSDREDAGGCAGAERPLMDLRNTGFNQQHQAQA